MGNFDERVQSAISEARDLVEESILEEHGEISLDAEVPFDGRIRTSISDTKHGKHFNSTDGCEDEMD